MKSTKFPDVLDDVIGLSTSRLGKSKKDNFFVQRPNTKIGKICSNDVKIVNSNMVYGYKMRAF